MEFWELLPMEPSRKRPKEGDVFLTQPFLGTYYYGKVIQTRIKSEDSCVNGMNLIFLYNRLADGRTVPDDLGEEDFLIPPVIINKLPWSRGYFETIGNAAVTESERNRSYGFWRFQTKTFVDVTGAPLAEKPLCWSDHGLASYAVVGERIQAALKAKGRVTCDKDRGI